jgi:peroxiredoxin Q/BCP
MKTTKPAAPAVGDRAPALGLKDSEGRKHDLKDYRGSWVLLFFYPRDNTPGCTLEACAFRDVYKPLRRKKVTVLGVSTDPAESHEDFRKRYRLPFALLVDDEAEVSKRYGVWQEKLNFGRRYLGIVRSTFVIDPKGLLAQVYRGVKAEGHVDEVMEWLRQSP